MRPCRQDRRRRGPTDRAVRLFLPLGIAALVAAIVAIGVDNSGLLDVAEVEVVGVNRLSADEVRAAAGVELGSRSWALDRSRVAERVERLPLVGTARVERAGPDAMRIEVRERDPVLQVRGDETVVLVDRAGTVLIEQSHEALPVIEVPHRPPAPGGAVSDDPVVANAHAVWRELSGPLRVEVVTYRATTAEDLELVLRRGITVRFGRAERVDEKVRSLGAVLADVADAQVEYIDVRAPANPVIVSQP